MVKAGKSMTNYPIRCRGNALFLVLMGVALFGILSYVVTQTSSGGGNDVNSERATISASEILEYAKQLESGVDTIIKNGYSEGDISFAHADLTGYGTYDASPNTEVFNPKGGGAVYRKFLGATSSDWVFTGRNRVVNVGSLGENSNATCTDGNQVSCADLVAILGNISKNLCLEINKKLNIPQPSAGNPPKDDGVVTLTKFTGAFTSTSGLGDKLADGKLLWGKTSGCFEGGGTPAAGTYHFYHVLLAR